MSETSRTLSFRVDAEGRLVADPFDARQLGLRPGDALRIETGDPLWVARRPVTDLARVYVEPTNACNLACATCVRNVWSAQSGFMSEETFDAVRRGLTAFPRPPAVFFGGFGEPLAHPRILSMIEAARHTGASVEMITNGILLGDEVRRALASLGLHRLWVSIDGATPAAYRDVRIGDALPEILENLAAFRRLRDASPLLVPRLGIAFVAMRRNVAELPAVVRLGREAGMDRLLVTNVLAYTADLKDEVLYDEGLAPGDGDTPERPAILLPRLETFEPVRRALATVIEERAGRCACAPLRHPRPELLPLRREGNDLREVGRRLSAPASRSSTSTTTGSETAGGTRTPAPSGTSARRASPRSGPTRPTSSSGSGSRPSTSPRAAPATRARWPTTTSKIAPALPSRPAAAVSGRRG